ncbi:MAG: DUF2130 domain-containing protein [Hyphomicrobium sp.]
MAFFQSSAASQPHVHLAGDRCPTCDQPIPNDRLAEVRGRIDAHERQLQAEFEARTKTELQQVRAESAAAIEASKAAFAAREGAMRQEIEARASEALAAKLKEAADAKLAAERMVAEVRGAMEKAKLDAVNAEQSKNAAERLKFEAIVDDLKRKLDNKSVEDLGEGAEVDLFETLKAEFPHDLITRVGRGNAGADVIHEVRLNGQKCGVIVYDSKNHQAWRTDHATKLRDDKIAAKADHAVLSTRAFPAGKRQLHVEHGVVIANPARAAIVALLLREQIVRMHALKVSNEARTSKSDELYALMTSERFGQFMTGVEKTAAQLEALQVQEKKAHETVWKKQGELFRSVIRNCAQFDEEVARIIGTAGPVDAP